MELFQPFFDPRFESEHLTSFDPPPRLWSVPSWLEYHNMGQFRPLFESAGYDMATVCHMTTEDLNAIGITHPIARRKIKSEIVRLYIPDMLPDFIPETLEHWMQLLRLAEYTDLLKKQGYTSVQAAFQLTWEDLEEVGISRLGHQKKLTLAIKRGRDLLTRKRAPLQYRAKNEGTVSAQTFQPVMLSNSSGRYSSDATASKPSWRYSSDPTASKSSGRYSNVATASKSSGRCSSDATTASKFQCAGHYGRRPLWQVQGQEELGISPLSSFQLTPAPPIRRLRRQNNVCAEDLTRVLAKLNYR